MRILNLGCGNDMYGTHRIDFYKTDATTEVSDLNQRFPYEDNFFDEIYCKSVLEHIRNLAVFTDECYRVLKSGGKLWLRTDHAGFILIYLSNKHEHNKSLDEVYNKKAFGHDQGEDHHYHLFTESHLKHLFNKFKDHTFNYFYGASSELKKWVYVMMPKNTGACHIEMECYK